MADDMISPGTNDQSQQQNAKRTKSKTKQHATGGAENEQPRGTRRRPQRIPQPVELIDQLRQLGGLSAMGILPTDKANFLLRCMSKIADISLKLPATAEAIPNHESLVEACRQNASLIGLIEPFLTDDQISELTRQVSQDGT
jgi:hypothetical protein